jgi:hypothetical protein
MPLFEIQKDHISAIQQDKFPAEKRLQHLIEGNLPTVSTAASWLLSFEQVSSIAGASTR